MLKKTSVCKTAQLIYREFIKTTDKKKNKRKWQKKWKINKDESAVALVLALTVVVAVVDKELLQKH